MKLYPGKQRMSIVQKTLIIDLNLQINEIVQYFNEICKNEDIKSKKLLRKCI